jgi:hypothetical protein
MKKYREIMQFQKIKYIESGLTWDYHSVELSYFFLNKIELRGAFCAFLVCMASYKTYEICEVISRQLPSSTKQITEKNLSHLGKKHFE